MGFATRGNVLTSKPFAESVKRFDGEGIVGAFVLEARRGNLSAYRKGSHVKVKEDWNLMQCPQVNPNGELNETLRFTL